MNFDTAFERLLGHEGGYVSPEKAARDKDPGGETKFGICKRDYPNLDICNLTLADAKTIYALSYWGPAGCDRVPEGVKYPLFDYAVNSGVSQAVKSLQRCVGAVDDGVFGPKTLAAVNEVDPIRLVARLYGHRLELMTRLNNWPQAGRGWATRVSTELKAV